MDLYKSLSSETKDMLIVVSHREESYVFQREECFFPHRKYSFKIKVLMVFSSHRDDGSSRVLSNTGSFRSATSYASFKVI